MQSLFVTAQLLAAFLAVLVASAQTTQRAVMPEPSASAAEVTAFMQKFRQDPNEMLRIESNPKRVPLLLGAIEREPAGPWANLLLGLCFQAERTAPANATPARRAEVSARAVRYLSAARTTISKALRADPQNRQLRDSLGRLDQAVALAKIESGQGTNAAPGFTQARNSTNSAARSDSTQRRGAAAPNSANQVCGSRLKQIDLAKQMWKADYNKPQEAVPTVAELSVYLPYHQFPKCPDGGTYTIGKLSQKPRCSIAGHELPKSE